jgi:hypothetical protein
VIKSGLGNIETVTLYSSNWRGREQAQPDKVATPGGGSV